MKKIILVLFCILLMLGFARADSECPQCNETHEVFDDYVDWMSSILNLLSEDEDEEGGSRWIIKEAWEGAKWFWAQASQWVASTLSMALLNVGDAAVLDIMSMRVFRIIYNGEVAIRDWRKLMFLKEQITDKALELGFTWVFMMAISSQQADEIENIIEEDFELIEDIEWVSTNKNYYEIFQLLVNLHYLHEEAFLFAIREGVPIRPDEPASIQAYLEEYFDPIPFEVTLDYEGSYSELKDAYSCATGITNNCPGWMVESVKENIESIAETGSEADEIWDRYVDSMDRLVTAFTNITEPTQREEELLDKYYWWEADRIRDADMRGIGTMRSSMQDLEDDLDQISKDIEEMSKEQKADLGEVDTSQTTPTQEISDGDFAENMKNTMEEIFVMQENNFRDNLLEDPRWITDIVPELSIHVWDSIHLLWDKDEELTIIDSLWRACQAQCTNFGDPTTDCWYDNL